MSSDTDVSVTSHHILLHTHTLTHAHTRTHAIQRVVDEVCARELSSKMTFVVELPPPFFSTLFSVPVSEIE